MKIEKRTFGILGTGKKAYLYTLKAGDLRFTLTNYGADWVSIKAPAKNGPKDDILLGYSTLDGYAQKNSHQGATVGRFANRIALSRFSLEGKVYPLYNNDGGNSLHGGRRGYNHRLWKSEAYEDNDGVYVRMELESPDGEEGYPGNLKAQVTYGITKSNELIADYLARLDKPCPVNLTNHSYFNLAGEGRGDILSHRVKLYASRYLLTDSQFIPTGVIAPVAGTPFDFTKAKVLNRDIAAAASGPGGSPGYDNCFIVDGEAGKLRPCAEVSEEISGRVLRVRTTCPGVQFYTGNFLTGENGKYGSVYDRHAGFCLETQYLPDSPNQKDFPSAIFGPGRDFHEKTVFSFDVE